MEGIIFTGIQASGKSTFYKAHFFQTHMRISLDLLNTRNKERQFLLKCIELHQRVVIDNTNPTVSDRKRYIILFKQAKYKVVGYYFQSKINESLERNKLRKGKERIPHAGIWATYNKLEIPSFNEGFDELYFVNLSPNGFKVMNWKDEI